MMGGDDDNNTNDAAAFNSFPPWPKWSSIGLDNSLAPNRRQAIIWTNADLIHWRIYAALGIVELMMMAMAIWRVGLSFSHTDVTIGACKSNYMAYKSTVVITYPCHGVCQSLSAKRVPVDPTTTLGLNQDRTYVCMTNYTKSKCGI